MQGCSDLLSLNSSAIQYSSFYFSETQPRGGDCQCSKLERRWRSTRKISLLGNSKAGHTSRLNKNKAGGNAYTALVVYGMVLSTCYTALHTTKDPSAIPCTSPNILQFCLAQAGPVIQPSKSFISCWTSFDEPKTKGILVGYFHLLCC